MVGCIGRSEVRGLWDRFVIDKGVFIERCLVKEAKGDG